MNISEPCCSFARFYCWPKKPQPRSRKSRRAEPQPLQVSKCLTHNAHPVTGWKGKGNGPAAPALKAQPADLTLFAQKNGGKFPTMSVMLSIEDVTQNVHGSKEMPVWGPILSSVSYSPGLAKQRIRNLTRYIESLQVK